MAKIHFRKSFSTIQLKQPENLMRALMSRNVPVASSCGGEGVCAKCQVKVTKGKENLSVKRKPETECLARNGVYEKDVRLSCQCSVMGDVEIDTDYW